MTDRPETRFLDRASPPHIMTLVLLASLSALSMNIFLPSLPAMARHFGTDYAIMQLSVSLFLAVNAALQLVIGPVADRFGRRPVLLAAIVLFILATLGTLIAPTVEVFLFFRMCQAVVVAAMVLSRAVVRDMVGEAEAASMIGYVTMGMALVPMVGPMLGGALDELFGWQASFVVLLICGVAILLLTWADLGETAPMRSSSFRAQFAEYPALLRARRFWGYCLAAAFASGSFFGFLGGAPFVGSEVFGLSPSLLGIYFAAPAVGYLVGNGLSGRYSTRIGVDRMVLVGTLITTGGMGTLAVLFAAGLQSAEIFFGFFVFVGLGNGMVIPNATAGMLSVRPHLAGTASGLGGAMMIGGGAAMAALAGALLQPGSGAGPLIAMLVATSLASVAAILYVIRRKQTIGA